MNKYFDTSWKRTSQDENLKDKKISIGELKKIQNKKLFSLMHICKNEEDAFEKEMKDVSYKLLVE